jgi:probable F420-dependent oxidoreductase
MTTPTIDLGRFGVFTWDPGSSFLDLGLAVTPEQARDIEQLGYGTVWVNGSPPAELSFAEPLLESTTTLKVATGIVNIWTADAKTVAESFHRINTAHPGRFVLGIGAGHPEHTSHYRKPYDALVVYLDELDDYGVPAHQRVLAALGPRVLRLAAQRTAGAHQYNSTPEHTAQARAIIGPNALLATPDDIARRLGEHLQAGANHVVIQVLGGSDNLLSTLSELAGPLGLSTK